MITECVRPCFALFESRIAHLLRRAALSASSYLWCCCFSHSRLSLRSALPWRNNANLTESIFAQQTWWKFKSFIILCADCFYVFCDAFCNKNLMTPLLFLKISNNYCFALQVFLCCIICDLFEMTRHIVLMSMLCGTIYCVTADIVFIVSEIHSLFWNCIYCVEINMQWKCRIHCWFRVRLKMGVAGNVFYSLWQEMTAYSSFNMQVANRSLMVSYRPSLWLQAVNAAINSGTIVGVNRPQNLCMIWNTSVRSRIIINRTAETGRSNRSKFNWITVYEQ